MIVLDLSILNQKGTPMFYSDIFANRPAFGVVGRIFISIDTAQMFRDTGTSWVLISDAGAGSSNLQQITDNGSVTTNAITTAGLTATNLAGGGSQMVVVNNAGVLGTQAIPTSTNIYNSNGTLTSARTITSGGHNLTFEGLTNALRFRLSANNNVARIFSFATADVARWAFRVDGNETGANAGANLAIRRYDDAGNFIDSPIEINRSTSNINLKPKVLINGASDIQGALQINTNSGGILINTDNANFGITFRNTSSGNKNWDVSSFNNTLNINESLAGITALTFFPGGGIATGNLTEVPSAKFNIDSSTRGFLLPRMTSAQRIAISTPATGLLVYQTDGTEGLYQNTSGGWTQVGGGGGTNIYNTDGSLTGNRNLTLNAYNLTFTGSSFTNRFTAAGRLLLGTTIEGTFLLDVNADARINTLTIGKGNGNIFSNTAIGFSALKNNTTGFENTAIGYNALLNCTTGFLNTIVGYEAGLNITTGERNVIIGRQAATSVNISNAVIIGQEAGQSTTATGTIAIGFRTGKNITGSSNIAIGYNIGNSGITGSNNTLLNGGSVTSGSNNIIIGLSSGNAIGTGNENTIVGNNACNGSGSGNVAMGYLSLHRNGINNNNTSIGYRSLGEITTGSNNIALGFHAGYQTNTTPFLNTTGNNSIYIGYQAKPLNDAETNEIVIGYQTIGLGSNTTIIGNSSTTTTKLFGNTEVTGTLKTKNPVGGTAQAFASGSYVGGAPTATGYVEFEVNGVLYKLLAST